MTARFALLADRSASALSAREELSTLPDWTVLPVERTGAGMRAVSSAVQLVLAPMKMIPALTRDTTPRVLLIAYGSPRSIERAYLLGAVDYLADPWSGSEAAARARHAVFCDARTSSVDTKDSLGSTLVWNDRTLILGPREAALWKLLARNVGFVVTRDTIVEVVKISRSDRRKSRAVDALVSRLRRSIGADGERIEAVRGRGYRLRPRGKQCG